MSEERQGEPRIQILHEKEAFERGQGRGRPQEDREEGMSPKPDFHWALAISAQGVSRTVSSANPTSRAITDRCVTRISTTPLRTVASRSTSTRLTKIEGVFTRRPD